MTEETLLNMGHRIAIERPIQTSDVWPSKTVTLQLGISQGKDVELVHMSIGSGPILHVMNKIEH